MLLIKETKVWFIMLINKSRTSFSRPMCSSPFFQCYKKAQKRGPKYRDQHHFIRQKYPYTFCLVTGSPYPPDLFRLDSRSKLPHSIRPYRRRNQPSASGRAPFPTPTIKVHLLRCISTSFPLSFLVFFSPDFYFYY